MICFRSSVFTSTSFLLLSFFVETIIFFERFFYFDGYVKRKKIMKVFLNQCRHNLIEYKFLISTFILLVKLPLIQKKLKF